MEIWHLGWVNNLELSKHSIVIAAQDKLAVSIAHNRGN